MNKQITVETTVYADPAKVWEYWNEPAHMENWMHASDDWECSHAENDVREGGKFLMHLQAKDGSAGFDLPGTYTKVVEGQELDYTMGDGRTVTTTFTPVEGGVHIIQTFEMEMENPEEMQRGGWQATLDSFKAYVEK